MTDNDPGGGRARGRLARRTRTATDSLSRAGDRRKPRTGGARAGRTGAVTATRAGGGGGAARRRSGGTLATAAVLLALVAGVLPWAAGPAAADAPPDPPSLTLAGPHNATPRTVGLLAVDDTGYLSTSPPLRNANPSVWIPRQGAPVTAPASPLAVNGGYGLERATGTPYDGGPGGSYLVRHYATGTAVGFTLANTDFVTHVFSANRLVVLRQRENSWSLHELEAPEGGGPVTDREVTGLPSGIGAVLEADSDSRGAAFAFAERYGGLEQAALLDFATAHASVVPNAGFWELEQPHLSGDRASFLAISEDAATSGVYLVDRDRPQDPGVLAAGLGSIGNMIFTRVLGDWVVYRDEATGAVRTRLAAGGPTTTLLARSTEDFVEAADGSLDIEGGTDAEHWAIQRLAPGADGAPVATATVPLPAVSAYGVGGIAVDQDRLLLAAGQPADYDYLAGPHLMASALSLSGDGTVSATAPQDLGDLGYVAPGDGSGDPGHGDHFVSCYDACLRLTGTGEGSVVHPTAAVPAPVSASGGYVVVRTDAAHLQLRHGDTVLTTAGWRSAALWGASLWVPGAARGTLTRLSLPSLRAAGTVTTGADCVPSELQAAAGRVYWSCGPDGAAGVYDLTAGTSTRVPSGYAELGDGYVVTQDSAAHKLRITYLPGALASGWAGTSDLAPLSAPTFAPDDLRGRFWAVDRFGGPVAYQTAAGDITVKWPQVTASPLELIAADATPTADLRHGHDFTGVWHLSEPTASWTLAITSAAGAPVATLTGGAATGRISASWAGRAANGTIVPSGTYHWALEARVRGADGGEEAVGAGGPFTVRAPEHHDYGTDGVGDLLTFDAKGRLAIQPGDGRGGVATAHKALAGGWPVRSTIVPVDDLGGDYCADLLVRTAAGTLVRYDGRCGLAFTPSTPPHRTLGTGFGGYDVLTSPGDLTGDHRPDLVARDRSGVLWRYSSDAHGGLAPRVRLVGGQGGYTTLTGAGDLNGDGFGDLVGRDRAGVLWRWFGDGKGAFRPRVRIGTGFSAYTALAVPGDLTGDGRPDLVARDRSGVLWRWTGKPNGTFSGRVRVSSGWNAYTGLF